MKNVNYFISGVERLKSRWDMTDWTILPWCIGASQ